LNGGKWLGGDTERDRQREREERQRERQREKEKERERGEVAEKETKREVAVRERGK